MNTEASPSSGACGTDEGDHLKALLLILALAVVWPWVVVYLVIEVVPSSLVGRGPFLIAARTTLWGLFVLLPGTLVVRVCTKGGRTSPAWLDAAVTRADVIALLTLGGCLVLLPSGRLPLALLAAAFIEELVFRASIPRWIVRTTPRAGRATPWLAVITAQLGFAACHTISPTNANIGLDFGQLCFVFGAGLLYWQLYASGGIALATAGHSAVNLLQLNHPLFISKGAQLGIPLALLGSLTLWFLLARLRVAWPCPETRPEDTPALFQSQRGGSIA